MMLQLFVSLLISMIFMVSCEDPLGFPIPREKEPNDTKNTSNGPLSEGKIYRGRIEHGEEADTDIFHIPAQSGKVYIIELETDSERCDPYLIAGDTYSSLKYAVFPAGEKGVIETFQLIDDYLYIHIGDAEYLNEENETCGDFSYWFRITSRDLCESCETPVNPGEKLHSGFDTKNSGNLLSFQMEEITGAFFGISVNSENETSKHDKKMFILNCDSGKILAGNDDLDYESEKFDPYIYRYMEKPGNNCLVVDRWYANHTKKISDPFSIEITEQPVGRELEPNDLLSFANAVPGDEITGYAEKGFKQIKGVPQFDRDMFRQELTAGKVFGVTLEFLSDGELYTELYSRSRSFIGGTVVPMKFNYFKGKKGDIYFFNGFVNFTGTTFFSVQGEDVKYRLIPESYPVTYEETDFGKKTFYAPRCETVFVKYDLPDSGQAVRVMAESENQEGNPGIYFYDSEYKPFLILDPHEANTAVLFESYAHETYYIGIFHEECIPGEENSITLNFDENDKELSDPEFSNNEDVFEVQGNSRYKGYFNTDMNLYENRFLFKASEDGYLVLQTAAVSVDDYKIDTVLTVTDEEEGVSFSNDDMVESFTWNPYSYLRIPVIKNRSYSILVTPFMDSSSHVESMNIDMEYILDIVFQ